MQRGRGGGAGAYPRGGRVGQPVREVRAVRNPCCIITPVENRHCQHEAVALSSTFSSSRRRVHIHTTPHKHTAHSTHTDSSGGPACGGCWDATRGQVTPPKSDLAPGADAGGTKPGRLVLDRQLSEPHLNQVLPNRATGGRPQRDGGEGLGRLRRVVPRHVRRAPTNGNSNARFPTPTLTLPYP